MTARTRTSRRAPGRGAAASPEPAAVILDGELTIHTAAAVHQQLTTALATGAGPLTLTLTTVTDLDTAGLQVLLAAARHAAAQGRPLHLRDPSGPVRDILTLTGLDTALHPTHPDLAHADPDPGPAHPDPDTVCPGEPDRDPTA